MADELQRSSKELDEYRKKERIYLLHKRCAEDQTKKVSSHGKKLMVLQTDLMNKGIELTRALAEMKRLEDENLLLKKQFESVDVNDPFIDELNTQSGDGYRLTRRSTSGPRNQVYAG